MSSLTIEISQDKTSVSIKKEEIEIVSVEEYRKRLTDELSSLQQGKSQYIEAIDTRIQELQESLEELENSLTK